MSSPGEGSTEPRPAAVASTRAKVLTAAAAVLVLVLTGALFYQLGAADRPAAATPTGRPTPTLSKSPTAAEVYAAVAPSVVSIEAVGAEDLIGTGIIVNADASILTALHVVKGARTIRVTYADGTVSAASVTASDPTADIATLTPATLPSLVVPAVIGSTNRLAVGDPVLAIGNPLGLTRTTTSGVVSGLDRAATAPGGGQLAGLIQFDAAVNPGSSGGPLLNAKGETIGIVVALANPTSAGTFIGIGFAVPIGAALSGPGGGRPPQQ